MTRPTVKPTKSPKQNQGQPTNNTNKQTKNEAVFDFYHVFEQIWVTSTLDILNNIAHDYT